jgi:hypothetical protein
MNVYGNVDVDCVVVVDAGDDVTKYDAAPFTVAYVTTIDVLVAALSVAVPGAGESVWTLFVVTVELIPAELTAVIV